MNKILCKQCKKKPIYVERSKAYCKHCFDMIKRSTTAWNNRNPERRKEIIKNYNTDEKHKISQRIYRETHKEELRAKSKQYHLTHKEEEREASRQWYQKNKEYANERERKYRKTHLNAYLAIKGKRRKKMVGTIKIDEWKKLLDDYGNKCLRCGGKDRIEVDHIVPISRGGTHTIDNVQPLCSTCNKKKYTKTEDYRQFALVQEWT